MVELTIRRQLRLFARSQIHNKKVVIAHKGHPSCIGRKLCHLLRTIFREWNQHFGILIVDPILRRERTTIDRMHLRGQQNPTLIGAEGIVREFQLRLLTFAVKNHIGLFTGLVTECQDSAITHCRIVLTVIQAAHPLYGSGSKQPLFHLLVTKRSLTGFSPHSRAHSYR